MSIKELKSAPKSLWVIMLITFFDSYAYFVFSYTLILYLREDIKLTDQLSGLYYGIFGVTISIFTLLLGHVVDRLHPQKTLIIANIVGCIARLIFVVTYNQYVIGFSLFVLISASIAIGSPVMPTAIRRYTTNKTQNVAFSIQYVVMNLGAILASPTLDLLRKYYPLEGIQGFSRYGFIILISSVLHLVDLLLTIFGIKDVEVDQHWVQTPMNIREKPKLSCISLKAILKDLYLWRFIVLSLGIIGVRSTYRYLDALYPTYMERIYGPEFPYMSLLIINPILVIVLTVPVSIYTARFHPYYVILVGVAISAASPFMMLLPGVWGVILFLILLTIGEIIWSPQFQNYVCWLAPVGKEGVFFSLTTIPLFVAKIITGGLSGALLTMYCSSPTECMDGQMMWLIIGFTTLTSPILLLATIKFIKVNTKNESEDENEEDNEENDQWSTDNLLAHSENTEEILMDDLSI